jgi:hypothetical protein
MADAHTERLLPRHFGLVRLVLSGTYSNDQMASMLGYTTANIARVIKMPAFQDELARRRKAQNNVENVAIRDGLTAARDLLNQTSLAAVEKMEQVMATSGDPKLQLDAADKILKYAFPKGDERGSGNSATVVVMSDAKLDRLRQVLSECGFVNPDNVKPEIIAEQSQDGNLRITGI